LPDPPKLSRRKSPSPRSRRPHVAPRWRAGWQAKLALAVAAAALLLLAWGILARQFAPASNTSLTRFDAIIVLGTTIDRDGNPTPELLARVTEAVREYEQGVAPRLILTGGPRGSRFLEARVMAQIAHAQGVPESALFLEPEADNTIQNACYSVRIMKAHAWRSAEVVSDARHLVRAGLIFSRAPIEWRTHPAPPLAPESAVSGGAASVIETLKTVRYLAWARQVDRCQP